MVTNTRLFPAPIDRRAEQHPGLTTVDWTAIAAAIADIEPIEVVHGPQRPDYDTRVPMGRFVITGTPPRGQGLRLNGAREQIARGDAASLAQPAAAGATQ